MSGRRKGSAGHRDRKPITQRVIARPLVRRARQVLRREGSEGLTKHLDTLTDWQLRTLENAPAAWEQSRRAGVR